MRSFAWAALVSGALAVPAGLENQLSDANVVDLDLNRRQTAVTPAPPGTYSISGSVYLGLYISINPSAPSNLLNGIQQTVQYLLSGPTFTSPTMTWNTCTTFCRAYSYCGIEGATTCRCGNDFAFNPTRALDAVCSLVCRGNPSQCCGAVNRLLLFRNLNPVSPPVVTPSLPPVQTPSRPPTLPSSSAPARPSAVNPGSGGLPSLPIGQLPSLPIGQLPSLPIGQLPSLPLGQVPTLPSIGLPVRPSPTSPAAPAGTLPSIPLGQLPSLPIGQLPSLPIGQVPTLPSIGLPVRPSPTSPAAPAGTLPSIPLGQLPGVIPGLVSGIGKQISSTDVCLTRLAPAVLQQVLSACF